VRRALQVAGERQAGLAAGAIEQGGEGVPRRRLPLVQGLENLKDSPWAELQALERVEPDDLARKAEIEANNTTLQAFEFERLHPCPATGAARHPVTIDRCSGGAALRSDTAWNANQDLALSGRTCGQFTQYRAVRAGCQEPSIRCIRA
jgi:hypothetical protein